MVQLRSVGIIQSKLSIKTLVKLHGSLMVVAWICLSSIAIMVARYYKDCWDNHSLMGVKIWFFVSCLLFAASKRARLAARCC